MVQLNNAHIDHLPKGLSRPNYDRAKITPGIIHFGVGNFFRAHEAYYVNKCLALSGQQDWGIIGVGLSGGQRSEKKASDFKAQDGLYTLVEAFPDGKKILGVEGALLDYLLAPADPEAVLTHLADPNIRIVSMTLTEGGYNIDEHTGQFRLDAEAIKADLANPTQPSTAFGYVVEGLRRRKEAGVGPFTVMSCDNLRHNGNVAKKAFLAYAYAYDKALGEWVEKNVTFPNGMVDRITPSVDADTVRELNRETGVDDLRPLLAESFTQWVLEDNFCAGRPAFEKVGVQMTDDVTGYEQVKIRMLNASHGLVSYAGILLGERLIHVAMHDPKISKLMDDFLEKDVIPQITPPEGVDLNEYKNSLIERFGNPAVKDQLLRIASDATSKIQVFWTETVQRSLQSGRDLSRLAFVMACYLEMLCGKDEKGNHFTPKEPTLTEKDFELARSDDLAAGLALPAFDGWRKEFSDEFKQAIVQARQNIRQKGVHESMPI